MYINFIKDSHNSSVILLDFLENFLLEMLKLDRKILPTFVNAI